jgi:hypothetical protein
MFNAGQLFDYEQLPGIETISQQLGTSISAEKADYARPRNALK